MITLLSAGALACGIGLAVADMVREARRDGARARSRAAHPARGGARD